MNNNISIQSNNNNNQNVLSLFSTSNDENITTLTTDIISSPTRKRQREENSNDETYQGQIYGITTYDASFKYVLTEAAIRLSFLNTFVPHLKITSSTCLDEHMNATEELQILREIVHNSDTSKVVNGLRENKFAVINESNEVNTNATVFLNNIIKYFDDIKFAFPEQKYNGKMDFSVQLSNGEYALVEMQVIPQNNWDNRALGYVAAFYGNQLRKGDKWAKLKKSNRY